MCSLTSMLQSKIDVLPLSADAISLASMVALIYVGLIILRFILSFLRFIWIYFLRPAKNLKRSFGSWAVVTGATDGIGRAYCEQLARSGLNLVLISRTQSRLDEAAEQLSSKYSIETRVIAADLTKLNTTAAMQPIAAVLNDLDIGVLVNNAGMSYDHPEYVETYDTDSDINLITINTIAPALLSKIVLPGMKSRRRGAIINIGSANGLLPAVPLLSVYAGTKAFINQFTRSLNAEVSSFGVRVQDQCPMFVATKMSKIRRARLDAPTPDVWARAAVRQVGYETVLTPYWFHGVMLAVVDACLPAWAVTAHVRNLHLGFRKAFYRKQARKNNAVTADVGGGEKKGL